MTGARAATELLVALQMFLRGSYESLRGGLQCRNTVTYFVLDTGRIIEMKIMRADRLAYADSPVDSTVDV
jgi:hypothetical protein